MIKLLKTTLTFAAATILIMVAALIAITDNTIKCIKTKRGIS